MRKSKRLVFSGLTFLCLVGYGSVVMAQTLTNSETTQDEVEQVEVLEGVEKEDIVVLKVQVQEVHNEVDDILRELEERRIKQEQALKDFIAEAKQHKFESYDLTTKSNLTGKQLDMILDGTGLQGLGDAYAKAEQEYGVSAFMLIALSVVESGWGTSNFAVTRNNLVGFMAYDSDVNKAKYFDTKEDCIMTVAKVLSRDYLSPDGIYHKGYTLTDVNEFYASSKEWAGKITKVMNELVVSLEDKSS